MTLLNTLKDNAGARKARKRIGRGIGSGTGKTGGRGVKGQKSRSGVSIKGFEGGQMPLYQRLPKRGFNNVSRKDFVEINLGRLQQAFDAKKLDAGKDVDAAALIAAGVIKNARDGVRILGKGNLSVKANFSVAGVSTTARDAIEKLGGNITLPEVKEKKQGKRAARREQAAAKRQERFGS